MSTYYFRCQASTDHTTYHNKNNLNKEETFLWALQTWYTWFKWEAINHSMTSPQYREYNNNHEWPINTNDCLFFANKQSLLLRTSTRFPTCKTTHRRPVWLIETLYLFWGAKNIKYLKMKRNEINHSLFIVLLIDGWQRLTPSPWTTLINYPKFMDYPDGPP